MARGLNHCTFIGNLGADPELRYTQAGTAVANFNIAVTEKWTKDGEAHERTEWVRIVAWDKLAEICEKYLTKGKQVFISGKMQTRKWQDRDGVEKYTTEITAQQMLMLGGREGDRDREGDHGREDSHDRDAPHTEFGSQDAGAMTDDDIPF